MSPRRFVVSVLVASALGIPALGPVSLTPAGTPAFAQGVPGASSRSTVEAFLAALNRDDEAAARALLAPNAGFAYSIDGPVSTPARFDAWLRSDIFGPRARFRVDSVTSATPARVDMLITWGRGAPTQPVRYVFDMADGRITGWRVMHR